MTVMEEHGRKATYRVWDGPAHLYRSSCICGETRDRRTPALAEREIERHILDWKEVAKVIHALQQADGPWERIQVANDPAYGSVGVRLVALTMYDADRAGLDATMDRHPAGGSSLVTRGSHLRAT